jgi:hypothetical protein
MVGIAGYAWAVSGDRRPARSTPERLLVVGGVSLAAAGVALLVVGTGMDLFMIGLVEGRRAAVGLLPTIGQRFPKALLRSVVPQAPKS